MTAPNLTILVAGDALTLGADVEYSITVSHGRNDISSSPQASDAQLTLYGATGIPASIGQSLTIEAYGEPRFTGTITDITLTHLAPNVSRMELQAVGMLANLGLDHVGAAGYSMETLADRVDNILSETVYVYTNNSDPLMTQLALDAVDGGYSALTLLTNLGTETGGTLADLPDGAILWESYSRRGYGYNPAMWQDVTDPWSSVTYVWSDVYEATEAAGVAVEIPASATVWSPVWRNTVSTVINSVTVVYGTSGEHTEAGTDPTSITDYGLRAHTLTTQLKNQVDAETRVADILRSQSQPLYALTNIQVLVHTLSNPILGQVLGLLSGSRVELESLPAPHPIHSYMGVVEGWSETYTPGQHVLTLSLSDPRFSYAVAQWQDVDPALIWGDVNTGVAWFNVVLPSDLEAA